MGLCKYPAVIKKCGVKYVKYSLCKKKFWRKNEFKKYWKIYHSKNLVPVNSEKADLHDKTDTMQNNSDIVESNLDENNLKFKRIEFKEKILHTRDTKSFNLCR